jgi:diaminopropionate ammonia-lyase
VRASSAVRTPRRATRGLFDAADFAGQRAFFAARPDLAPTPLRSLPGLASALGLGSVLAKDETGRVGLNAFKAVGADYAVQSLASDGRLARGATLACASEGNHGRAMARAARRAGCQARVYMAASAAPARVAAIEGEGAVVVCTGSTYDDAVARLQRDAEQHGWTIVSDTAWPGYEDIPRRIMLGYTRLMDEVRDACGDRPPDVLFVPGGVGGLLGAVAAWARWTWGESGPAIVCVEPLDAACLQASARAGRPTPVAGPFDTIMAGLRCGKVSTLGFDAAAGVVDVWLGIDDGWAREGIRRLARPVGGDDTIAAGASGAAALGGLLAVVNEAALADVRTDLSFTSSTRALVLVTEGVTDPALFAAALDAP